VIIVINEAELNKLIELIPPFEMPERFKPKYVWFGWHPNYPRWSKSCWEGRTEEEAVQCLGDNEKTYYMALVSPEMVVVRYKKPTNLEPWKIKD